MKQLELFNGFKGKEIKGRASVISGDFGLPKIREDKQEKLFDEWWDGLIKDKIKKTKIEIENSEDPKIITWIKNPATRIKILRLNYDRKWIEQEIVTKAIPINDKKKFYDFRSNAKTEIMEFENMQRKNEDLNSLQENDYEDTGVSHYIPPNVDMDRAHFNEMCTSNKTHLLALYEKNHLDYKKDWWLSEEYLIKNLKISYKDANRLAYAFERLNLNSKSVARLMHGYVSDSKVEKIKKKRSWRMKEYEKGRHLRAGMKAMVASGFIHKFINYMEELAGIMQELKRNDVHSGETFGDVEGDVEWIRELDRQLQDEVPNEKEYEDRFSYGKDRAFGTHKLYYGEEGCSHELLTYINNCDQDELNSMKRAMFPRKGFYGNTIRAEYWYLTPMQKSQVWRYIKDRQKELDEADTITIG